VTFAHALTQAQRVVGGWIDFSDQQAREVLGWQLQEPRGLRLL
jgi:hypothetical protein